MMTTSFEHLINHRILSTFIPIEHEQKLQAQKNYLFDLSYLDVLNVAGDKAIDFLQGQLTCDMRLVSESQMIQGAQCNLKGRILSLMDILMWNGVKLVLPKDLTETTIKSLSKTALLSRVSLKTNSNLSVFGFYLQNRDDFTPPTLSFPDKLHAQMLGPQSCCYHLGYGFYILLAEAEYAHTLKKQFQDKDKLIGSLTWHTFRLAHQQVNIYPESRGLFLPHRLDLHKTQYISFNKGCYKGQEIIARMHYKATIKHKMGIYELKTDQKIHAGQKLLNEASRSELGELIDYSLLGLGHYLIAVSLLQGSEHIVLFDGHNKTTELKEYHFEV
jgi:tRNA-modifying protein YgfZ